MERKDSPEDKKPNKSPVPVIAGIGIGVIVVAVLIIIGLFFLPDESLARATGVSITFMAISFFFAAVVIIFLLLVMVWAVFRLSEKVSTLSEQVGEVTAQVKETVTTVRGTAGFVGERVASPFIRATAWASGVGKGVETFFKAQSGKEQVDE